MPATTTEDGVDDRAGHAARRRDVTLRYPESLRIAQLGFAGGIGVNWPVDTGALHCCGKQVSIRYATDRRRLRRRDAVKVYRGANGEEVPYFHGAQRIPPTTATLDYLVFQFGPWLVEVYDVQQSGDNEQRMTDEQRATWARSLTGTVDGDGWLVLHAAAPLAIGNAFEGGFGAPRAGANQLELATHLYCGQAEAGGDSAEHRRFVQEDNTYGVSWCVDDDLHVAASGTKRFVDQVDADSTSAGSHPHPMRPSS